MVELSGHPVLWLIDSRPQNRGFYTGLIELPKIYGILKECLDSGHPQRLYTLKNRENRPVYSKTHGVADFEYFLIESFVMILYLNFLM